MQNAEPRSTPQFAVRGSQFGVRSLLLSAVCYLLSATCYLSAATHAGEIDSLIHAAPASLGDAGAVVLLDRVQVVIDARNNRTVERHCLVKVFNQQGREDCQQVIAAFDQGQEKLEVLLAQVHTPDGRTVSVDRSRITEAAAVPEKEYGAARTVTIRFPDSPDGSALEYDLRFSPRVGAGLRARPSATAFSGMEPIGGYLPILNKELAVSFPRGREFHWAQTVPPDPDSSFVILSSSFPRVDTLGKTIRYVWIARQDSALPREPGEPVLPRRVPQIVYSSCRTWRDVAQLLAKRSASALIPTRELKQKAQELAPGKLKSEVPRALNRFVSEQIRTIPLGSPLAAFGYPPHPAAEILKQGYGSALDKACLLAAMLKAQGFDAYLLPIRTYGVPVIKDVPAPEAFDRVIVMVLLDNNPGYFDPCGEFQPDGRLPDFEQGAEGFALDPGNYRFVKLPVDEFDQNLALASGDILLKRDGSAVGTMTLKLTGYYDVQARRLIATPATSHQPQITTFAARLLAPDTQLPTRPLTIDSTAITDVADVTRPVAAYVRYIVPASSNFLLTVPAPELALETLFALVQSSSRRTNLVIPPWRMCRFICTIHPEDGVTITPPGPTWFKENSCLRVTRWWEPFKTGIEFKSEFLLKKTDLTPDDYRQVKAVLDQFRKPGLRQLHFSLAAGTSPQGSH
jgi:hypothetical protein